MQTLDVINTGFEAVGSVMVWANVNALRKARTVAGVYWPSQIFYAAWGGFNLAYYAGVGHWGSFCGQVVMFLGSCTWATLAWRYRSDASRQE